MSRYDAMALSVDQMLAPDSAVFQVPPFQRRYAWSSEQVGELLSDIFDQVNWLDNSPGKPYFLGSLVLSKTDSGPDLVLDGQQRLTTISLILAVLKHKLAETGHCDAEDIKKYLQSGQFGGKKTPKIRLQPEDKDTFAALISDPSLYSAAQYQKSTLARAVKKIDEMLKEKTANAIDHGLTHQEAFGLIVQRLLSSVEFVRIVAPSESEAFRLFETLNDRGLPLSAADLIKNKLFAQSGDEYLREVKEAWEDTVESVGSTETVHFLRYFWIATQGEVRKNNLYDVYNNHIKTITPKQANDFAKDMRENAKLYRNIIDPKPKTCAWGSESGEALERINVFRARSCYPALLACAIYNPRLMPAMIRACEVITVRYSVVSGLNSNQLERVYGNLCKRLRDAKDTRLDLNKVLHEESKIIPTDQQFEDKFMALEIDRVTPTWRTILVQLNTQIATGETRIEDSKHVHVEHILPQNPSIDALAEAKLTGDEVKNVVDRIGNLTLLSSKMNREISNGPFSRKQPVFASSEIKLNHEVAASQKWGADEIETRSLELAMLAVQAWPWPI